LTHNFREEKPAILPEEVIKTMRLFRKIVTGSDKGRKEIAKTNVSKKDQTTTANENEELDDKVWQRIVEALAARGYPPAKKDVEARKR
jgi:hypothetical protein